MNEPVVELEVTLPDPAVIYSYQNVNLDLTVTPTFSGFVPVSGAPSELLNIRYDFGDGTVVVTTDLVVQHEYTRAGTYTLLVTVTDTAGLSGSASTTFQIYREIDTLPVQSVLIPPFRQHTPLDAKHPAFMVRRPRNDT